MTIHLSRKLTFFSFWLIIVVVLLHSNMIDNISTEISFFNYLQYLLSMKLAQIAVPLFFIISGFLFFIKLKKEEKWSLEGYKSKLKKKFQTLLIPYLLWSVFWYIFMYLLQVLPFTKSFFNQPFYTLTLKENFYQLFVYPLNYPFWFLRELMFFIIITPILLYMIRKFNILIFFILFGISFLQDSLFVVGGIKVLHIYPLLYFTIGCYIGIKKVSIEKYIKPYLIYFVLIIWLVLNSIYVYFDYLNYSNNFPKQLVFITNLLGCFGLWFAYDSIKHRFDTEKAYFSYSFFIFAFHGIPILFFKKIMEKIEFENDFLFFVIYLTNFSIVCFLSLVAGMVIKRYYYKTYNVLTGNR